jgi:S-adenosylmethionine synthetase
MMPEIRVEEIKGPTAGELGVEIVERKGLGHPDTICDLVMERVSVALSQAYIERFGSVLHHNCDKGLLVAGEVQRNYGGGRVVEPMRLVIGDRATFAEGLHVGEIAVEAARAWFREKFPEIDPDRHLKYQVELRKSSEELAGIFRRGKLVLPANDTSAAVGYAPLSDTETLVLEAERFLNGPKFKATHPETGRDVKIMGVRSGSKLSLTVAIPFLDKFVDDEETYFRRKQDVTEVLLNHLKPRLEQLESLAVQLNALDQRGLGFSGMYLSVLGTSAEDADSGEVGRGNQVNGIIALNRPRGSEAAAGKNPVSHVGKIYSVLAHILAGRICKEVPGLQGVTVWLCSRIGDPIDQPQMTSVQVKLRGEAKLDGLIEPIRQVVALELSRMPVFCAELAQGKYAIC